MYTDLMLISTDNINVHLLNLSNLQTENHERCQTEAIKNSILLSCNAVCKAGF